MGVETASYISQLSATNPLATDPISQGDDQIRLVKDVLQKQFTTLGAAAVTTTAAELNVLDGIAATLTSAELDLLDGCTATTTELNYVDVAALGTVQASKAVTADASGIVNHADYIVQKPKMKDYSEAINAAGSKSAAFNIDLEDGNVQSVTVTSGTFNVGITNALASNSNSLTIIGTNLGTGTITWKSGAHDGGGNTIKWPGGSAPPLTSSGTDILTFTTFDGGTQWYGFAAGLAMA